VCANHLLEIGVQGVHPLDQGVALAHLHGGRLRPLVDRISRRALLLGEGRQCLLASGPAAGKHAQPVPPELPEDLVRYPEAVSESLQHVQQVVSGRFVVAVEVEEHVRVHHSRRRPQRLRELGLGRHAVPAEVIVQPTTL